MDLVKELHKFSKELNLLFVEDDDELRNQMEGMFRQLFNDVESGESGKKGLQVYKERLEETGIPFDLVITDINMPEMNGIEMIHAIYAINPLQPVIVISAHNESDYLMDLLHIGIDSFLIKPVKHSEMVNTLYKVTKGIVNERLVEAHYQEVEELNAELSAKTEALQASNEELREKNIALEKSMRIIEGMQHKEKIHRNISIPVTVPASVQNEEKGAQIQPDAQKYLDDIGQLINDISLEYTYKGIKDDSLRELSQAVTDYADTLPKSNSYQELTDALKNLGSVLGEHPKCSSKQELERILCVLESFFFIYTKWQNELKNTESNHFEKFSKSIEDEITMLINVWNCEI